MNRIDRLSAILIQLQSRRVVKASDIAQRFGISIRTVYRDIRALEEAGIPLIGEAGAGYSLVDGYRLPPIVFSREEAIAMLTAEKLVEKLTDRANGVHYNSAMFKIKAVLQTAEKDLLEHIDKHIEVLPSNRLNLREPSDLNLLQTILKSIAEKKILHIRYFTHSRQEITERNIEPLGIFFLENYWHLIAFCHSRNDYRNFRLDRIQNLQLTETAFQHAHPSIKDYLKRVDDSRRFESVTIKVDKTVAHHLSEQKFYNGFISETQHHDFIEMHFVTPSLEGFARWFMSFADYATIIAPEDLKERVHVLIDSMAKRIKN